MARVTQSKQIRACHMEMQEDLSRLKRDDVSFREFIGYEMAVKRFEKRFRNVLSPNQHTE